MALYSDFAYFVAGLPPPIRKNGQKVINMPKKRTKTQKPFRCTGCQRARSTILRPICRDFPGFSRFSPILPKMPKNPFGVRVANASVYGLPTLRCTGCKLTKEESK